MCMSVLDAMLQQQRQHRQQRLSSNEQLGWWVVSVGIQCECKLPAARASLTGAGTASSEAKPKDGYTLEITLHFSFWSFSSLYVMPKPALISLSEAKCDMSTFFLGNPLSAFGELRPFVVATLTIQPPICHVHFTKVAAVVAALEAVKAMKAATAAARAIADCYSGSSNSSQLQPQPDTHCHSTLSSSLLSSFT